MSSAESRVSASSEGGGGLASADAAQGSGSTAVGFSMSRAYHYVGRWDAFTALFCGGGMAETEKA